MTGSPASFHAIYLVLNEWTFFEASLRSVYPHVTGVTVVTSHDFDRYDAPVVPDRTVPALLSRELDPERKVNVVVAAEGGEAALRNRAMAFASPPRGAGRVGADPSAARLVAPDWFWIVDADEVWDAEAARRLQRHVVDHPADAFYVAGHNYFRSWNWRVEGADWFIGVVRPGTWFGDLRHVTHGPWRRAVRRLGRAGLLSDRIDLRLRGLGRVPADVAAFHHGSFVGDRRRIEEKLLRSGHHDQFAADWIERVWDRWHPEMRDLHPYDPPTFPVARHVPTGLLPAEVADHPWPEGWIEPPVASP